MVKYKEAKKNARRFVSGAKGRAYYEIFDRFDTKEGKKGIYKMKKKIVRGRRGTSTIFFGRTRCLKSRKKTY
jgi:hypothetical protein